VADVEQPKHPHPQNRAVRAAIADATTLDVGVVEVDSVAAADNDSAQGSAMAPYRAADDRQQGLSGYLAPSPSASASTLHTGQRLHPGRSRLLGEAPVVEHPCLHKGYLQHYSRLSQDGAIRPAPARVVLAGR
jgi:hypothetical protein